jgi:hypothetical protein
MVALLAPETRSYTDHLTTSLWYCCRCELRDVRALTSIQFNSLSGYNPDAVALLPAAVHTAKLDRFFASYAGIRGS